MRKFNYAKYILHQQAYFSTQSSPGIKHKLIKSLFNMDWWLSWTTAKSPSTVDVKDDCFDETWAVCLHLYFTWYAQNIHILIIVFSVLQLSLPMCIHREITYFPLKGCRWFWFPNLIRQARTENRRIIKYYFLYMQLNYVLFVVILAWFEPTCL